MGSAPKKVGKAVAKPVKQVVKGVKHVAEEGFEELIEKPGKKIIRETVDTVTGSDKYDRGAPRPDTTPAPVPKPVESTSDDDAARRSQIAGATGSADRRRFVKAKKLS